MKIKIEEIKEMDNKVIVKISSLLGCIYGEWKTEYPILNKEYYIEFGVYNTMKLNVNLFKSVDSIHKIQMVDKQVLINGLFDSYEDDCLALRIGDSLILLEVTDLESDYFNHNDNIRIILPSIEIYDIHII